MKQLLSIMVIAGTLTIITFSSCKKEDPVSGRNYVAPPSYQPGLNLNLVANSWVNETHEIYTNTFQGVLGTANADGNRTVLVYLEEKGVEVHISQRHITFMGNEMWATNSATDVIIYYRSSAIMPFHSLNIRVEVR